MSSGVKKIIFFLVLIGILYIGYQYMIKPANRHLAEARQRTEEKIDKLEQFERASSAAQDLGQQLQTLEESIAFFESKLPSSVEIDKVLQDVTVIAQRQGLSSRTFQTLDRSNNSGYIEQPLKMELEGDFHSFYSFLLQLEQLPRIMKISQLDLQKSRHEEGQISADFIVSIFFQHGRI